MMLINDEGMRVFQPNVAVRVTMWLRSFPAFMNVLVMFIMNVNVVMQYRFMYML